MRNKKTIALAMAAATVAPMAVPAFAAEKSLTPVNDSTINLKYITGKQNEVVPKESVSERLRQLQAANLNPEIIFVNVDGNGKHGDVIVSYDHDYSADDKNGNADGVTFEQVVAEKKKLANVKEFITYANSSKAVDKETNQKLYTVTTKVNEYKINTTDNTVQPSSMVVTVRENFKTGSEFKTYTYTFKNYDTEFEVGDETVVKTMDSINLTKGDKAYKRLAAVEYSLKNAKKKNPGLVITSNKITTQGKEGYEVNIYKKDGVTKLGKFRVYTDDKFTVDSTLRAKYKHVELNNDFNGHWAEQTIVNAMLNKVVSTNTTFKPKEAITRAEFASVIYNTFADETLDQTVNPDIKFNDVSSKDWYAAPVMALAKAGFLNGNPDGSFKPNAPITREEAAKIMADIIYAGGKETYKLDTNGKKVHVDIETSFKDDSTIASWADESVLALTKTNATGTILNEKITGFVISGDAGKNTFRGKDSISRAEALVMAERAGLAGFQN